MARTKTPRTISKTNGDSANTKPEVKKTSSGNGDTAAQISLLEEQIRFRAYELFEQRGKTHGHAHEDWIRAEAEVRSRSGGRTA